MRRLAGWVSILGFVAAVVVGLGAGYMAGLVMDGKAAQFIVGSAVGIFAAAITITPYLVVVAVLELLTDLSERVRWLTGFLYESRPEE